jgi:hypothetical protein
MAARENDDSLHTHKSHTTIDTGASVTTARKNIPARLHKKRADEAIHPRGCGLGSG